MGSLTCCLGSVIITEYLLCARPGWGWEWWMQGALTGPGAASGHTGRCERVTGSRTLERSHRVSPFSGSTTRSSRSSRHP